MAALSIGTHLPPLQQFKKPSLHSLSLAFVSSLHYVPSFGTSLCRIRGPRLRGNGVLARAEDKARQSSSAQRETQQQPNNQKQFEDPPSSSGLCDPLCSLNEMSSSDFEATYQPKTDSLKALAVIAAAAIGAVAINHSWVAANQDTQASFSKNLLHSIKVE